MFRLIDDDILVSCLQESIMAEHMSCQWTGELWAE